MAASIRAALPQAEVTLIEGGGGDFIVIANGEKLWDKRAMGDAFPDEGQLVAKLS